LIEYALYVGFGDPVVLLDEVEGNIKHDEEVRFQIVRQLMDLFRIVEHAGGPELPCALTFIQEPVIRT
jgi:hypothetical protein